ncbi:diacylglycerol/lipid kinase family protein [Blastococcus brunescens]|uniref:Diacylglycerol kinase family protein n=1 Tax=Blastococcus brunescens TaxID=1564165 RepID=A0ABZ1B7T4_9ACTN|nr:diacylglycerol kinase family protein [Blastococcus sp. BMG 8361]WRL66437.1 diacylglycerol kinase family protein [Blastococcus sp. BMG 8361]
MSTTAADVVVLVSPSAGRGRGTHLAGQVLAAFRDAGFSPEVLPATTGAEGERQAGDAVAAGARAVVAVGGDGTVHAALQAVAGTPTPLALIPAGTGNDLARALGGHIDPAAAARAAADDLKAGTTRSVDAGRTGDRWWATVLCCGFDSAVSDRANRMRWPRGRRRYDVAVVAELARLRPRELTVVLDGESQTLPVTMVAVGNTAWYGGGLKVCPGADPADGLFDVTVVGASTRLALMRQKPRLATGAHVDHPAVSVFRASRVELSSPGVTAYADGEPVAPLPAVAECVPGALHVVGTGR